MERRLRVAIKKTNKEAILNIQAKVSLWLKVSPALSYPLSISGLTGRGPVGGGRGFLQAKKEFVSWAILL
jgi:hypothetical protein